MTSSYDVLVQDKSMKHSLIGDKFRVHPGVTDRLGWAEVFFPSAIYSRGDTVKIYMDGKLIFQGEIKREHRVPGVFTVYAYDKLIRWRDEPLIDAGYYEYFNDESGDILKDLLNHYFSGEFDVTNVDTGTAVKHFNGYGQYLYDIAPELARRESFDLWLDPPNKVWYKEKETQSSGVTIKQGRDILDIDAEISDLDKKDQIIVKGRRLVSGTHGTGSHKFFHADENILTDDEATEVAESLYNEKSGTLYQARVLLKGYRDLRSGKTVILNAPEFGFNAVTVRSNDVTHSPKGTEFRVGSRNVTTQERLAKIMKELKILQEIAVRPTSRTFWTDWQVKRQASFDCFDKIDLDRWTKILSGGSIEAAAEGGLPAAKFTTGAYMNSNVRLESKTARWGNTNWRSQMKLKLSHGDNSIEGYWGNTDTYEYIRFYKGFGVKLGLWAQCAIYNGTQYITEVEITGINLTQYHIYRIDRIPGNVKFYVDDILKATITTNIPTVDLRWDFWLCTRTPAARLLYVRAVTAQEELV